MSNNHPVFTSFKEQGFTPINVNDYMNLYLYINPDANTEDLKIRLEHAASAKAAKFRCACGGEIWIAGSAERGLACFTCLTGEAYPDNDYEIEFDFTAEESQFLHKIMEDTPAPTSDMNNEPTGDQI